MECEPNFPHGLAICLVNCVVWQKKGKLKHICT